MLSMMAIFGIANYMAANGVEFSQENLAKVMDTIGNEPAERAKFYGLLKPSAVAGVQAAIMVYNYSKFAEFLSNPKLSYFFLHNWMQKKGYSTETRRAKAALLAVKEAESFARGAAFQVAFYSPIFAVMVADGTKTFDGVGPFLYDVFFATFIVTTAQSMTDISIGNIKTMIKERAQTLTQAKNAERSAVAATMLMSMAVNSAIAMDTLNDPSSEIAKLAVGLIGAGAYFFYWAQKIRSIRIGQEVIIMNKTPEEFWESIREKLSPIKNIHAKVSGSCGNIFIF